MSDLFENSFRAGRVKVVGDKKFIYERSEPSQDPSTEYMVLATDLCPVKLGDLVFYEPYSSNMGIFKFILMM